MIQEKPKTLGKWLAEHTWLKVIGAIITIIVGLNGILAFVTGAPTLPDFIALFTRKYYDDFENTIYDGSYNTDLWRLSGIEGVLIEQRNGTLVIQPTNVKEGGNIAISPREKSLVPFTKFKAIEADMKMNGDVESVGFIKTQAFTVINNMTWWLECQLVSQNEQGLEYFCNVHEGEMNEGGGFVYSYETQHFPVEYDKWYHSRLELDLATDEAKFYLNDRQIGKYKFKNIGSLFFSSISPQFGSWVDIPDNFVGYYDNIVIEDDNK